MRIRPQTIAILCGAVGVLLYLPTLAAQFVWDDHVLIVGNPDLQQWGSLPRAFTAQLETLNAAAYYRPLLMASYLVDRHLWDLDPMGFHLTNVLLHGIVSAMVCAICYLEFRSLIGAAFGALLFAVHPIQAQSVALVLGRNDLLLAIPIVGMLIAARVGAPPIAMMVLYALALCTKETGIIAPALVFIRDVTIGERDDVVRRWRILGPAFVLMAVVYLATRYALFGTIVTPSEGLTPDWQRRLINVIVYVGYYVRHVLLPWGLSPAPYSPQWLLAPAFWAHAAFVACLIGAIILAVWHRATPAYGLLFFGSALAPVSGLVPVQVPVLEHRLYLPMVGVALAVSAIAARLHGVRVAAALGAALFGGLAAMTAARLPIFHDDFVLWTTAVQAAPDSAYAWHGYAMSLAHLKRDREAVQVLEKVLDLDPNYARARYELGVGFERIGEHDKAVATIEDLLRRSPADIGGWNALAFFAKKQGDFRKSQQLLEQGLEARPRSRTLRENLADVLALRGDVARAMEIAEELLREDPRNGAYRARLERLRNAAAAAPRAG